MSTVLTGCIGIFWDYENCRPPSNISGAKLVENICRLVRGAGAITQFKAYVDVSSEVAQPRSVAFHSDLQSSGVTLAHCPHNGKKDVADKMMIADMLAFALDRPAPAKVVIITGDRDFAYASAILRLRGYETVIISPPNTGHASLKMQADQLLDWQKDVIDASSPDTFAVVEAVSQSTAVKTAEDYKPKAPGSPGTCPPAEKAETGTYLSNPAVDDIFKSSTGATMDNTGIDAKPSPKETVPIFLKSLSTFFSDAQKSSQVPSFQADVPSRPDQPVAPSSKVSNETGCILLSSLKAEAEAAGLSVGALRNCRCANCRLSSSIEQDLCGISTVPTVKQSAVANPEQHYISHSQVEDAINSSTNTPSSVSTATSSSVTSRSTTSSFASKETAKTPSPASVLRFRPLINYFIEQQALTGLTRIRSSTVASELRKHDSMVYEKAGVVKMKQYIEEAREATIIISPGLDKEGDGWIEINPSLYPGVKPTSTHKGSQLNEFTQIFRPASSLESIKTVEPVVDVEFKPLVTRLRMESPVYRLVYSMVGQYFKTHHPFLYEDAGVCNLTQYLQKAIDKGIVRAGNINSPGRQWVELTDGLRYSQP